MNPYLSPHTGKVNRPISVIPGNYRNREIYLLTKKWLLSENKKISRSSNEMRTMQYLEF